ncbi:hypothetical protein VSH64_24950 [Amycolatopsis rhabdoformis]|uniref:Uncharacterized protein n=1 Tax=Amycolatopsis rhabdoformis TaxID=1448059 RepID=A0ABZ1HUU4_9PSEU|nr:hypothetical protein [Amycolatopsis rhabdoformis]WSE26127.1 hypothetical protein VSH64_24950 [Amycolatopsis rhabdoformis]
MPALSGVDTCLRHTGPGQRVQLGGLIGHDHTAERRPADPAGLAGIDDEPRTDIPARPYGTAWTAAPTPVRRHGWLAAAIRGMFR